MDERQIKIRIRQDKLVWILDHYHSYKDGINDCIDRCMNDTTIQKKQITAGMQILTSAVKDLYLKYPDIDFSGVQKGVDLICQTSSHSKD